MEIILASASPRRKELLSILGVEFQIIPATQEEVITKDKPEDIVLELSCQKAKEVTKKVSQDSLIIGADTIVALDGRILGKPVDKDDAIRMLQLLEGRTHQVYTGVTTIVKKDGISIEKSLVECTDVTFYPMSIEEIEAYVDTKEPMDKAGSYGIQGIGGKFVKGITGDYHNVVGFPVSRFYQEIFKTL